MNIAVIGAGLMGRAAVYDFSRVAGVDSVGVFDIDEKLARKVAEQYGNGRAVARALDAGNESAVEAALKGYSAALSCVTYRYNPGITRAAIKAGCHLADLGGNNDAVRTQLAMDAEAARAGVIIVPDCGLAPGMVAILAADAISRFDITHSIRIRVGGLPQNPRPPLNYQMVFSAEGLINEYWEPCVILEKGQHKTVEPMSSVESLAFEGLPELEAFYTSGGTSTLPDTYRGKIDFLDYKTIRYKGHCELFRPMLELGLASRHRLTVDGQSVEPRAVFKAVLDNNLSFNEPDMVLVRLTAEGTRSGSKNTITYEIVDRQDMETGLTAMMRTTAFPAAIVVWMAAAGKISARGCKPQELVVDPKLFFEELRRRKINLVFAEK